MTDELAERRQEKEKNQPELVRVEMHTCIDVLNMRDEDYIAVGRAVAADAARVRAEKAKDV